MKSNSLSLAIRAALGVAVVSAAPAYAQLDVFYGGATATDNVLENGFLVTTGGICSPNFPIDIYRVTATNQNQRVIVCTVTNETVPGFPTEANGGQLVRFHKESIGGSSNGVVPLIDQSTLLFYDMSQSGSCATSAAGGGGATSLRAHNNWSCPVATIARVPSGGISDTEPNLSFPKPTATGIAKLTSTPGLDIIFGVPVTLNLYRALQAAQGLTQDDAAANVPSLTSAQIRGLYTQKLLNWDSLRGPGGVPLWETPGVTDPTNNATSAALDSRVLICRRVATSGTQASAESYFLQQRCDASAGGAATGPTAFGGGNVVVGTTPTAPFTPRIYFGESSGDVRTCLNTLNNNGNWAIGVLSTEVSDSNQSSTAMRMVRVDGALPNLASVANGDYTYFTTNTINRVAAGNPGEPTGLTLTLQQYIETNLGRPLTLSLANNSFDGRAWGDGGLLTKWDAAGATPNAAPQVDGTPGTAGVVGTMDGNPVNTQSRTEVNNKVNNCNPPVMRRQSPAF